MNKPKLMPRPNRANLTTDEKRPRLSGCGLEEAYPPGPNNEQFFFKIAGASTALGMGVLLASAQALKIDASGISFGLSGGTLAAFGVGAILGILPWKLASGRSATGPMPWPFRASTALILLSGVGAFLYPLRFVSAENLPEVLKGLAAAVCVLSLVAFLLWQIIGFLERDAARAGGGAK
jgi:hypothetical protein